MTPQTPVLDAAEEVRLLTSILNREIRAVENCDLDLLPGILEEKEQLMHRLESRGSDLAATLAQGGPKTDELRDLLACLRELLRRDMRVISSTARSLREVLSEVFGYSDREDLVGLYKADGRKNPTSRTHAERVDRFL